ncbi:MAG: T9SS type B sorting domain-containing protein [Saprospiraceae bacterium]|nr:T9SS type B sorting domain-containing protein [Saprospiraceae bacterium]
MKATVAFLAFFIFFMQPCLSQETQRGLVCCCGVWNQLVFPNFDFEDGPSPAPGSFIVYSAGSTFGGWTVTRATVDHVDALHAGLGMGNPNGASNFVDLHGSPGFGGISYKLTGLKPGAVYLLKFWTAQNGGNHSSTGTVKVAGGAWLNESWPVTISGAVAWFLMEFKFMAMADMAELEFSSVGDQASAGTLIDDISLFECPPDTEFPIVNNEPADEEYNCLSDVKRPPSIMAVDDCDLSPTIKLTENTNKVSDCEIIINREWTVTDDCNNTTIASQEIKVIDKEAPVITNPGTNKIVFCNSFKLSDFTSWVNIYGGTKATDNCKSVNFEVSYDKVPEAKCDTTIVTIIAKDLCGNETLNYLHFIVRDTAKPLITRNPDNVVLKCSSSSRDSLRSWLNVHGNAIAIDSCSGLFWKNNFNGDSSSLHIEVDFITEDSCGNKISVRGIFDRIDSPDTFRVQSFQCGLKINKIDTTLFTLPGCDSVVIHSQIGVNIDTVQLNQFTCDPAQAPKEVIRLFNQFKCDSTVIINYTYVPPDTTLMQNFICGLQDTVITITQLKGTLCDSIIIEEQYPVNNYRITIIKKSCDPLQVGVVNQNLKSIYGCDSIIVTVTELSTSTFAFQDSMVCGLKNNYTDTLKYTTQNCDSFHIIHFIASPYDSTFISKKTCNPLEAGIFYKNIIGSDNCDSTIVENISLEPVQHFSTNKISCNRSQKLKDTLILQSYLGCDSLVITNYQLKFIDTTFVLENTCNKSLLPYENFNLKGEYCDSVVSITRQYLPAIIQNMNVTTCHKDSISLDTIKLLSTQLCDSLVIIQKTFQPISFLFEKSDISCFDFNDGRFEILQLQNTQDPVEIIFDGKVISNQKIFNSLTKGKHFFIVKDNKGCLSDSVFVNIVEPPALAIDLGNDILLNKPQIISLEEKSGKKYSSYNWVPNSLFDCPTCEMPNANIKTDTTIFLIVQDENSCSTTDTLQIRIKKQSDVFAPNSFSPNGDGINDQFYLMGDENAVIQYLRIYDRWGNLVFEKLSPKVNQVFEGWNGTYKNEPVNPSVFIFSYALVLLDGSTEIRFGDLTLIK